MRKETRLLLDDLIGSGADGWVIVDYGEAEVIDMIEKTLEKNGFGIKTKDEIQAIAQEYEEEAINWAEREGLDVDYCIPVRIELW